jgi:hypothetical protein
MEAMKRNLYQRSTIFKDEDTEERNIHIGLDLDKGWNTHFSRSRRDTS